MFPREFVNICIYIAQLNTQIEEKCIQSNLTNEINIHIANTSIFALREIKFQILKLLLSGCIFVRILN